MYHNAGKASFRARYIVIRYRFGGAINNNEKIRRRALGPHADITRAPSSRPEGRWSLKY